MFNYNAWMDEIEERENFKAECRRNREKLLKEKEERDKKKKSKSEKE